MVYNPHTQTHTHTDMDIQKGVLQIGKAIHSTEGAGLNGRDVAVREDAADGGEGWDDRNVNENSFPKKKHTH